MPQVIVIDCAPFTSRPDEVLPMALRNTVLTPRESTSRSFGEWIFEYNDIAPDVWKTTREIVGRNLEEMYNVGVIRYAEW